MVAPAAIDIGLRHKSIESELAGIHMPPVARSLVRKSGLHGDARKFSCDTELVSSDLTVNRD